MEAETMAVLYRISSYYEELVLNYSWAIESTVTLLHLVRRLKNAVLFLILVPYHMFLFECKNVACSVCGGELALY
jgi:hypothetical protein